MVPVLLAGLTATQTVHTKGINWEAVAAISGIVALVITIIILPAIRSMKTGYESTIEDKLTGVMKSTLKEALDPIREDIDDLVQDLKKLDTRVAWLEGIEQGRRVTTQQLTVQRPSSENSD